MTKTVEQYIQAILRDIEKRKTVDLGDKNSVRRYNAAMDRIYKNVKIVLDDFPSGFEKLTAFLDCPDTDVPRHLAPMLFIRDECPVELKRKIVALAKTWLDDPQIDSISKFHISYNIKQWEQELADNSNF